jgi:hypothetical protein
MNLTPTGRSRASAGRVCGWRPIAPWTVHLEPHCLAWWPGGRCHAPPGSELVNDSQSSTALRLGVLAFLQAGSVPTVVGYLDAQAIRTRPHPDRHKTLAMGHRIGHQLTRDQLRIVELRTRPPVEKCMQPMSNSAHRGRLPGQSPDLHAARFTIRRFCPHHPSKSSEVLASRCRPQRASRSGGEGSRTGTGTAEGLRARRTGRRLGGPARAVQCRCGAASGDGAPTRPVLPSRAAETRVELLLAHWSGRGQCKGADSAP